MSPLRQALALLFALPNVVALPAVVPIVFVETTSVTAADRCGDSDGGGVERDVNAGRRAGDGQRDAASVVAEGRDALRDEAGLIFASVSVLAPLVSAMACAGVTVTVVVAREFQSKLASPS